MNHDLSEESNIVFRTTFRKGLATIRARPRFPFYEPRPDVVYLGRVNI